MSTESVDPELVEQTKQQIRNLVREIAQLSKSDLEPGEFYDAVLNRLVTALAAVGGAVWTLDDSGQLKLEHQINLFETKLPESRDKQLTHYKLLRKVAVQGEGVLVQPQSGSGNEEEGGNPTDFLLVLGPLKADSETQGLVEIFQRPGGTTNVQRGYLRFLMQMCELASDYLKTRKLRHYTDRQAMWGQLDQFTRVTHRTLDPRLAAYTVANEGRRLIECDRVSVGIWNGRRCTIEAISGQDTFDKRSNTVVLLGHLASAVCATGDAVWYTGDTSNMAPQVEDAVQAYVDEAHSKTVAIIPLKKPQDPRDPNDSEPQAPAEVIGAMIVEQIEDSRVREGMLQRVDVVTEHASTALANALEYNNLFLMPLWRTIGKAKWLVKAKTLPKTLIVTGIVLAVIVWAALWPATFEISADGRVRPIERRNVFAAIDGRVEAVNVKQGSRVDPDKGVLIEEKAGDQVTKTWHKLPLLKMNSPDLANAIFEIRGKLDSTNEQLKAVQKKLGEGARLTIKDRMEFEGSRAALSTAVVGYGKQLEALNVKKSQLQIGIPIAGVVTTWQPNELLSRPVQTGQTVLNIANPEGKWEVELEVPEDHMGHVTAAQKELGADLRVSFILATDPHAHYSGKIKEVHQLAQPQPEKGNVVLVKVEIDEVSGSGDNEDLQTLKSKINAGVTAKIECGTTSIGYAKLHSLVTWFQKMWFRL